MVSKEIVLKALIKNQDQLTELELLYSLGNMGNREYFARKSSLKLVLKKFKKDLRRFA